MDAPKITIRPHGSLKRRNLPSITGRMMAVLIQLRIAQKNDNPFIPLPEVDPRTIRALCFDRDWMYCSPGLDGERYSITEAGLRALKIYEPVVKRTDGICPRCGERPCRIRSTGKRAPYCKQCESQMSRRKYSLGLYRRKPGGLCVRCKKRPCFVASTGRAYSVCKVCKNRIHRRDHQRLRENLYIRMIAGEHIPCRREGCDRPRHISNKTVAEYCYSHLREYMNNYNDRRRHDSRAAKQRSGQLDSLSISVIEIFQLYPGIGTVEHLPHTVKEGQRYFDFESIHMLARREVPRDLTRCDVCNRKSRIVMVCPEGYAIYQCPKCQRLFRIILEFNYFLQEDC